MANLSSFPGNIDTFIEHQDISYLDMADLNRYQTLRQRQDLSLQEQAELNNLTQKLATKIFSAGDFNKMQDAIVNLETFFRDNVEGFVEQKQEEMQALVNLFAHDMSQYNHSGQWEAQKTYKRFNVVTWANELTDNIPHLYCALENSINRQPDLFPEYWLQLSLQGDKGNPGRNGMEFQFTGAYDDERHYLPGEAVQFGGYAFGCLYESLGNEPDITQDTTYWAKVWDVGVIIKKSSFIRNLISPTNRIIFIGGDIEAFNPLTDALEVFKDKLKQIEGIDYEINSDLISIDMLNGSWSGTIEFVVTRNHVNTLIFKDGNGIADETINLNKFTPRLQKAMLYAQYLYETTGYDFDKFSNRAGETYLTQFDIPNAGDITETIQKGDVTLATRQTQFDTPETGDITVTLTVPDHNVSVKQVTKFDYPNPGDISQYMEEV